MSSLAVPGDEGPGKTKEEAMEVDKNFVKTAVSGTVSANEDSSNKDELETNGSIEVDIETSSPKKPSTTEQNEEKSEETAATNPIQQSQQNHIHNNNNNNNESVQQNSEEAKKELNTVKETTPTPLPQIGGKKEEEIVVNKMEQPVMAEPAALALQNSTKPPVNATPISNHKEQEPKKEEAAIESEKKQGGLPKWMVQSANAPPSPSPEATEKPGKIQETTAATPAKGRGRGRRSAAQKAADAAAAQQSSTSDDKQTDNSILHRPRRSTRTRVDYANPDPMTVVAEADDEDPGAAKRGSAARAAMGRKPAGESKRGRKRKVAAATSGEDEEREEDDDDEEYGSKKKTKKRSAGAGAASAAAGTGKRRGRPAGSGNKGKTKTGGGRVGRPAAGDRRTQQADRGGESDDEHGKVVYDDRESEKETTGDESTEESKMPMQEVKKSRTIRMVPSARPPPKKRGRPPTKGKEQNKIGAPMPTGASAQAEARTDESAVVAGSGGDEPAAPVSGHLEAEA